MYSKYLIEIKTRIILLITIWICLIIIYWLYKDTIIYILMKPCINIKIQDSKQYFIYTNVNELFKYYFKNSVLLTNISIIPLLILELIIFLNPSFYYKEYDRNNKLYSVLIIICITNIILVNKIIIPITWNFFLSFSNNNYTQFFFEAKIIEYFEMIYNLYYITSVIILVFVSICYYTIKYRKIINNKRKYIYLFLFTLASIITPPDVSSQLLLGTLFIVMFETLSIIVLFVKMI
jgi:sec-independent protein translocase protein TatC